MKTAKPCKSQPCPDDVLGWHTGHLTRRFRLWMWLHNPFGRDRSEEAS